MVRRRVSGAGALAVVTGVLLVPGSVQAGPYAAERISQAHGGGNADDGSSGVAVSNNGRYVVFSSTATDLVSASDTNGAWDAFLYDRTEGDMKRVSKSTGGTQGNGDSVAEGVANDGTVVFVSGASNLVGSDTNGVLDVFVHEPDGDTFRVNESSSGGQADGASTEASISSDGNRVTFATYATNPGGTPGTQTIYLRNRTTTTTTARVAPEGLHEGMQISGNGDYIVFATAAGLVGADDDSGWEDVYLHDIANDSTALLSVEEPGAAGSMAIHPSISAGGRYVVFVGESLTTDDATADYDIYLLRRNDGSLEIVSVSSEEVQADVGQWHPTVSDDGRYVAFYTQATNLVPNDVEIPPENAYRWSNMDVFVRDRQNGTTYRASEARRGARPTRRQTGRSSRPGGGFVVFESDASNLVTNDTNGAVDIFEVDL